VSPRPCEVQNLGAVHLAIETRTRHLIDTPIRIMTLS